MMLIFATSVLYLPTSVLCSSLRLTPYYLLWVRPLMFWGCGIRPLWFRPLMFRGSVLPAVQHAEHHERQFDEKFQDKPEQSRKHNHGQFEYGKVSPGLDDHIPVRY